MPQFQLSPEAIAAGHQLQSFESVGSTNQMALEAAQDGDAKNLWIAAQLQTAGKGRRGREWQTATGNLAVSVFVKIAQETQAPHLLGFVAAIALANSINELTDPNPVASLKWPNDVLIGAAKLAGILLEAATLSDGNRAIVVGMGVNVASSPQNTPYQTAFLNQINPDISPEKLFQRLTKKWVETFAVWDLGRGQQTIIDQWLAMSTGLGKPIRVNRTNDSLSGVFEKIDEQGRLILRLENGQKETITAGDVFL